MKIKQGAIIRITFLDAFGRGSWNRVEDLEDGLKNHIIVEVVGYYLKEDKNFVVLSMGIHSDPNSAPFLRLEFIPKGAITKINKLT